jgi:hypothetical protein
MSQPVYNLKLIRKLMTDAFSDEELNQFCYDNAEFRPVAEQFSIGMSKTQKIQRLIEYCERKVLMARLLGLVKEEQPEQYALYENDLVSGGKKPEASPPPPNETDFLQKLINEKTRYLNTLQLQAAKYGISVPVHIAIEIEDLEKEISELRQKWVANR